MQDGSPCGHKGTLIRLKITINKKLGWSLFDIDETDFCNLLAFISFDPESDPDVAIINGKEYKRAKSVPDWL